MKVAWLVLLSTLAIIVLGACQQEEATHTPPPAAVIERASLAIEPTLLTLARNPSAFEGQDLRLSGVYRALPLLVCATETHHSPATWIITDGQVEIPASGFDSALRELASPDMPLVVEGRWQRWEGPVGCGRRAPSQLIWYLQLTNIVSPNPLSASLPVTPNAGDSITGTSPSEVAGIATPDPNTEATAAAGSGADAVPTATPTLPGAVASITPTATRTVFAPTGSATVLTTPTANGLGTPTPTLTGTVTLIPGSGTPVATATTDSTGSTPTATSESSRPILLDYDDLSKRDISAGRVQEWNFAGSTELPIIIKVAPSSSLDVSLELLDPNDEVIGNYNAAGAGQVEMIQENELPSAGLYTLLVSSVNQTSGSYAIVLQSESSRPVVFFQGTLSYGQTRSGTTPTDGDHLWNFEGTAGEVINIRVVATSPTDMQIYLNSYDGQETEFVNDNTVYFPPNDREEILGLRLPGTGLYTVGIGEEDLESMGYTIVIERTS